MSESEDLKEALLELKKHALAIIEQDKNGKIDQETRNLTIEAAEKVVSKSEFLREYDFEEGLDLLKDKLLELSDEKQKACEWNIGPAVVRVLEGALASFIANLATEVVVNQIMSAPSGTNQNEEAPGSSENQNEEAPSVTNQNEEAPGSSENKLDDVRIETPSTSEADQSNVNPSEQSTNGESFSAKFNKAFEDIKSKANWD